MENPVSVVIKDKIRGQFTTVLLVAGYVFLPLLVFFREMAWSEQYERPYALVVRLLIEWLSVRAEEFFPQENRANLLTAFSSDLWLGTYSNGKCPYGLGWTGTSYKNSLKLTNCLYVFSDWLSKTYGTKNLNPMTGVAGHRDQIIFWRRWNTMAAASVMSHLKKREDAAGASKESRKNKSRQRESPGYVETKAFPYDQIDNLLYVGCAIRGGVKKPHYWQRYNIRDQLIILACLYGGPRRSEIMHLWVCDVDIDPANPKQARVLIHHPTEGMIEYRDKITGVVKSTHRKDFLNMQCAGRVPLNMETGRRWAGWKGSVTTAPRNAFQIIWIDALAGELFWELWKMYVIHVRPNNPRVPWAFLTKEGEPLGAKGFDEVFNAAVERAGLIRSKGFGTTTQGMRHRYGQWLNKIEADPKEGQVALHHGSVLSQNVYRAPSIADVAQSVAQMGMFMGGSSSTVLTQLQTEE
ncbi:gamma-mobile-trio recombinase GmtY [Duganella sp. LjRoot269]|uniref:gamma-mobile-trio recombinase GmtY n=1 Tax=Duganella sp. LjRoot269 TaxID=3342305 RepID=UPI003ED031DA